MVRIDHRWVGPVLRCPACDGQAFQTVIIMDPEKQLPGMYFLDAECIECSALVKLATPLDVVIQEPSYEEETWQPE